MPRNRLFFKFLCALRSSLCPSFVPRNIFHLLYFLLLNYVISNLNLSIMARK